MFCPIDRKGKPLDQAIRELLPDNQRNDWAVLKELYELLNILDSKTSSLLTFDALILAVYAIVLQKDVGWAVLWASLSGTLLIVVSTAVCVWVVRMSWEFLKPETAIGDECRALANKVDERTVLYQYAWRLSFAGVFVLVLAMALRYGC